jgi:hypothetical protein
MKNKSNQRNSLIGIALGAILPLGPISFGATVIFDSASPTSQFIDAAVPAPTATAYLLRLDPGQSARDINFALFGDRIIDRIDTSLLTWATTSADENQYTEIHPPLEIGRQPLLIAGEIMIDGDRYAELLITPAWFDTIGNHHQIDSIQIDCGRDATTEYALHLRSEIVSHLSLPKQRTLPQASASSAPEYAIVTDSQLVASFEPLRRYRISCGIPTTIVTIEDIVSQYSGRDDAERLRNFLKSFYETGGRHVLLGGDASIVPIRYAYPYTATTLPALRDQLICDLYFADLTGEWDVDSDGIWGERYEDLPDLNPELAVGRLPVDSPEEVTAFISKLIRYEDNPGDGDLSYLTRTLFYSADQMRDYPGGGQHGKIAAAFPAGFQIDTVIGVETPTGSDPNPTNTGPLDLPASTRSGFGIVHVIAHGRFDGFVLKSSGYNEAPKQYVLTGGYSDIQCAFDSLGRELSPSFYYSLACDNGGFDLDRPPFTSGGVNMGRALLGSTRGAVAMVANSRWGWISSSYFLHKAFFDSLFVHPDEPAIAAMYRAQKALWYYRDLIYGQVFLGDPLTRLYTSLPRKLTVAAKDSSGYYVATVSSPHGRENGIGMILSDSSGILEVGTTSGDGTLAFTTALALGHAYAITAVGSGTTIGQVHLTPSITTGIDDSRSVIPLDYALYQNYPNPFNPSTVISFDLPKPARITLSILNVLGQEIDRPVDRTLPSGTHAIEWNSRDQHGRSVASGVYFYRLSCDEFTETRKLALVR